MKSKKERLIEIDKADFIIYFNLINVNMQVLITIIYFSYACDMKCRIYHVDHIIYKEIIWLIFGLPLFN
jgi:hypothetical protein